MFQLRYSTAKRKLKLLSMISTIDKFFSWDGCKYSLLHSGDYSFIVNNVRSIINIERAGVVG